MLLPLLLTSMYVTQNFLTRAKTEEQEKLSDEIGEVKVWISNNFLEYKNKSVVLFENSEFSSKQLLGSPESVLKAVRLLKSISLFDSNVSEILLFYGEGQIYFSGGTESLDTHFYKTLGCSEASTKKATASILSEYTSVNMLHGAGGDGYLLYHLPVGKDAYGKQRSVEVIMKLSQLKKHLEASISGVDTVLELCIGEDACYFYNAESGMDIISRQEADEILQEYDNLPMQENISELGIQIKIWNNPKTQLRDFYIFRNLNLIILCVGLFLSVALSVGLSVMRFSQMKELINSIVHKKSSSKRKKKWGRNEFDYIQTILDEAVRENRQIRHKARIYKQEMLHQAAMLIFHGLLRNRKEIQTILKVCGTELFEEYFYLCGIRVESSEQLEKLGELLKGDLHYMENEPDKHHVYVLCELPNFDFEIVKRKEINSNLCKLLESLDISEYQVVSSRVYDQISMANYAYLEIISMLKYLQDKDDATMYWEEWARQSDYYDVDNEYIRNFVDAIEQKNEQQAKKILRRMMQQTENRQKDDMFVRYIRYTIVQALQLGIRSFIEEEGKEQLFEKISSIDMEDAEKFETGIKAVLGIYCKNSESNIDKLIQYINQNYTSNDLSLETIANHMGISKPQMSKLFREQMGIGYIDYVTDLRMKEAQKLLAETNLSVSEVFMKVGYIDKSNATKKFKACFKMNPSTYRAMMKDTEPKIVDEKGE